MVVVQYNSEGVVKPVFDEERKRLKQFFENCVKDGEFALTTVVLQDCSSVFNGFGDAYPLEPLIASGEIHEEMLNLRFGISPLSFFQVNTPAAELLYSTIREWCRVSELAGNLSSDTPDHNTNTTLLDLCCGTGTIGITMASQVDHVVGIDITRSAVEDAKKNAIANGITNTTFIVDRVQDAIQNAIKQYCLPEKVNSSSSNSSSQSGHVDKHVVIAVLDPPRPGVHHRVISAIRKCKQINRVIFIACDAEQSMDNWVDLCNPIAHNESLDAGAFKLVRAQPFDLFPHTAHYELVLEFVRNQ